MVCKLLVKIFKPSLRKQKMHMLPSTHPLPAQYAAKGPVRHKIGAQRKWHPVQLRKQHRKAEWTPLLRTSGLVTLLLMPNLIQTVSLANLWVAKRVVPIVPPSKPQRLRTYYLAFGYLLDSNQRKAFALRWFLNLSPALNLPARWRELPWKARHRCCKLIPATNQCLKRIRGRLPRCGWKNCRLSRRDSN